MKDITTSYDLQTYLFDYGEVETSYMSDRVNGTKLDKLIIQMHRNEKRRQGKKSTIRLDRVKSGRDMVEYAEFIKNKTGKDAISIDADGVQWYEPHYAIELASRGSHELRFDIATLLLETKFMQHRRQSRNNFEKCRNAIAQAMGVSHLPYSKMKVETKEWSIALSAYFNNKKGVTSVRSKDLTSKDLEDRERFYQAMTKSIQKKGLPSQAQVDDIWDLVVD